MSIVLDNNIAVEMHCGINFAYNLVANEAFSATEYKVLQSQTSGCFVRCMKNMYNGQIQLYYMPESFKPLSQLLTSLDTIGFLTIVSNLFTGILDVNAIGFLSSQNIDASFEHIFVDVNTYKVKLIYVPLIDKLYPDVNAFESNLRTALIKCIATHTNLESDRTNKFSAYLSDGSLSLADIIRKLSGSKKDSDQPQLMLVAINAPQALEIPVNKSGFLIGKKADAVDGCISFNNYIGRIHCRIDFKGGKYTVTDLQSKNGTFVNRVKLQPDQPYAIGNNDIIRLANSDFRVVMK